jgi:hypothetical protein
MYPFESHSLLMEARQIAETGWDSNRFEAHNHSSEGQMEGDTHPLPRREVRRRCLGPTTVLI